MKLVLYLTALLPLTTLADQKIFIQQTNQPGNQGYNPSTERLQNQIQNQQQNLQLKLQQDQQRQNEELQRNMQEQRNQAERDLNQSQPGNSAVPRDNN